MSISVVIATYDRAALLDECLGHLRRQLFHPGDEVLVVDNGSSDDTPDVVRRYQALLSVPLHYLHEPIPGKSRALARALTQASGDVVAFTDDDVNVEAAWLDAIRTAMASDGIALVGGPVIPRWERTTPRWLQLDANGYGRLGAPLALLDYGSRVAELGPRTLLGANLAIRRSVLDRVGGFAPELGKLRGTLLSGEDHDLCERVQAAGFRAVYWPDARVHHWVPASRTRLRYFLAWFFWSGITNAALDETAPSRPRSLFGLPRYLIRRFAVAAIATPFAVVAGRAAVAAQYAVDAAFALGYASKSWGFVRLGRRSPVGPAPRGEAV